MKWTPNWSQIIGVARILVPAVIAVLAFTHVITDSMATNMTAFALSVLGSSIWSGVSNSDLNIAKAAASTQGVQVVVDRTAAPELQQAAVDPKVKDIVRADAAP
jgi:hypothetical protein